MARVSITFYLNILAGIFVLFSHFAASETGDTALTKVAGAAGRFYTVFRDAALTFYHGCASYLEMAVCGFGLDGVLPRGVAEFVRVHYCHAPGQEPRDGVSNGWRPHGYGGSDFSFMYYQAPMQPFVPRASAEGLLRLPFSLDWPSQNRFHQVAWSQSGGVMAAIGLFLLRTGASWWWFRAPFSVTGVLVATYAAFSALSYLLGANVLLQHVFEAYAVVVTDFLQCMEWEALCQIPDIAVMMMEQIYVAIKYSGERR